MNFGKYKGRPVDNVPKEYLEWCIYGATGIKPELLDAIRDQLFKWGNQRTKSRVSAPKPKEVQEPFLPRTADKDAVMQLLQEDALRRANTYMQGVRSVFTDGGVYEKNPSDKGGMWAWCGVNGDGERIVEKSGVVYPDSRCGELKAITNNHTELLAVIEVLSVLPDDWSGTIATDSKVTLCRLKSRKDGSRNVPPEWWERMKTHLCRMGELRFLHLSGHPTQFELDNGISTGGLPVSKHNVWCDKACNEISSLIRERWETR